ncbi:MAG: hypothetical protein GY801_40000 [bacterium]|nr:hypothetical protein [bacterium]
MQWNNRPVLHAGFCLGLFVILTFLLHDASADTQTSVAQPVVETPFLEKWTSSGHADATTEAFTHWDEEDPQEIPVECAKCHSTTGYRDFIGVDGSAVGVVDTAAPIGTVVECIACHNDSTLSMNSVVMPSGAEISDLGREVLCMQCHQGRASKFSVDNIIKEVNPDNDDTVNSDLNFVNIHYYAATAAKYGTIAKGGYQYAGKSYDTFFAHVDQFDTCIECHDSHTLQIQLDRCRTCHEDVERVEDLKNIRMPGSLIDYDGDGNVEEGIYYEIEHLQKMLYQAIQHYAVEKNRKAIVYAPHAYPYFFIDSNGNTHADKDEVNYPNKYNAWTARLLKAGYNYQFSLKDPGAFAHGGKYVIELLFDSIEDLNSVLSSPVGLNEARRIDNGHFAGSEEAFRHWDDDGEIPASCSKCHSSAGLPLFLKDNTTISQPVSNGFHCTTCHDDLTEFTRYDVAKTQFPSRIVIDSGDSDTNLCMNCHQGRQSMLFFDKWLKQFDDDTVSPILRFWDVHYSSAGATLFGTEAKGAYEYENKEYLGVFEECDIFRETEEFKGCLSCHSSHGLSVEAETCESCHTEVKEAGTLKAIRSSLQDYDGDAVVEEGLAGEIDSLREALYAAIQNYAKHAAKTDIVYDAQRYPYFFTDLNANGTADPDESTFANRYAAWTPKLLRAAYNYQYSIKDAGAFAHNGKYIIQILYDSLENLGTGIDVDINRMIRP